MAQAHRQLSKPNALANGQYLTIQNSFAYVQVSSHNAFAYAQCTGIVPATAQNQNMCMCMRMKAVQVRVEYVPADAGGVGVRRACVGEVGERRGEEEQTNRVQDQELAQSEVSVR